jgi:hypothetical protein
MWIVALHHIKMVGELAMLWAAVSSVVEVTLGHSPNETFRVEVLGELVAKFQRLEERCSCLEQPGMRIYDLLLGPPSNRV